MKGVIDVSKVLENLPERKAIKIADRGLEQEIDDLSPATLDLDRPSPFAFMKNDLKEY